MKNYTDEYGDTIHCEACGLNPATETVYADYAAWDLCQECGAQHEVALQGLTPKMKSAHAYAMRFGAVFAGENVRKGRIVRNAASTLLALERRGLGKNRCGPDGGMMFTPTI